MPRNAAIISFECLDMVPSDVRMSAPFQTYFTACVNIIDTFGL